MIEKAIPLTLPPGVFRNGTKYQAKNRWYVAQLIRWYEKIMGPIGGWRAVISKNDNGVATGTQSSTTLKDTSKTWTVNQWAGKEVNLTGGTGAGQSRVIVSNTVDTLTVAAWGTTPVSGSTVYNIGGDLVLTGQPRAAHGWKANDGLSHLAIGTHNHLFAYVDGELTEITTTSMTTASDTDVNGHFVGGNFGDGGFGLGNFGTGSGALTLVPPPTWQLDNFGELLIALYTADGYLEVWSPSGGYAQLIKSGVPLVAPVGSGTPDADTPVDCIGVVVTPEHFVVALGADGDARKVKWADQESLIVWTPDDTNQAGSFELPTKGRLVTGLRSRRQTVLWTSVDVYGMNFAGGNEVYEFEQLGDNCGLISPRGAIVLGDRMFWMSYGKFFKYDGALTPLDCDVQDEVFNTIDMSQAAKVNAVPMTLFNEIWWLYPSKNRTTYECDKVVAYNFEEMHWMLHDLPRSCGIDRGVYEYPILVGNDTDLRIYEHEYGDFRSLDAFGETGPVELGEGDQLLRVQQIIPDEKTAGDVTMTLLGSIYPNGPEKQVGPFIAQNPTPTRLTARQVRFRIDEAITAASGATKTNWRVGVPRLGVLPSGSR